MLRGRPPGLRRVGSCAMRTLPRMRSRLPLLLLLAALGCSHRHYQYTPPAAQAEAIDATAAALAAASDERAPLPPIDLTGRVAVLELLGHTLLQRKPLEPPSQELLGVIALVARGTEASGRAFAGAELEASLLEALDRLGEKAEGKLPFDLEEVPLLGALLEAEAPSEEARRSQVVAQLRGRPLRGCEPDSPRASYDAALLRHVETPDTETWAKWTKGLEGLHLVTLRCEGAEGAVLLSSREGGTPAVVAWQLFSPEAWAPLEERLRETLD